MNNFFYWVQVDADFAGCGKKYKKRLSNLSFWTASLSSQYGFFIRRDLWMERNAWDVDKPQKFRFQHDIVSPFSVIFVLRPPPTAP
jgi:hypothetical protein